jgi:ferritin-like metal-binding protein YciE
LDSDCTDTHSKEEKIELMSTSDSISTKTDEVSKLFQLLDHVEQTADKKFRRETVVDASRLKWGRLLVTAIEAHGKLLHDRELEDLIRRIEKLEAKQP